MGSEAKERAFQRKPLHLMVEGRVRTRRVRVTVMDVSEGGCLLKGSPGFANVGETISLKLGSLQAPMGCVAWVEGQMAGVAFAGKLHPAMLDHLLHNRYAA